MIKIKNIYAKVTSGDGRRILVDLFWPEGLKTREAEVDEWMQELGPTYDLQRFHLSHETWDDYKSKYEDELLSAEDKKSKLRQLADEASNSTITLLYGNNNPEHNHATILKALIESGAFE